MNKSLYIIFFGILLLDNERTNYHCTITEEYEETYKKISLSMTQTEFQREVGRLDVLGELIIKNK